MSTYGWTGPAFSSWRYTGQNVLNNVSKRAGGVSRAGHGDGGGVLLRRPAGDDHGARVRVGPERQPTRAGLENLGPGRGSQSTGGQGWQSSPASFTLAGGQLITMGWWRNPALGSGLRLVLRERRGGVGRARRRDRRGRERSATSSRYRLKSGVTCNTRRPDRAPPSPPAPPVGVAYQKELRDALRGNGGLGSCHEPSATDGVDDPVRGGGAGAGDAGARAERGAGGFGRRQRRGCTCSRWPGSWPGSRWWCRCCRWWTAERGGKHPPKTRR